MRGMGIPLRSAPDEMIRAERRALLRADAQIGCPISGSEAVNICSVWALPLLTLAVIRKHSLGVPIGLSPQTARWKRGIIPIA